MHPLPPAVVVSGVGATLIHGRPSVKKLFVVLLAAGVGFAAWRKAESGKSHEKLWAEATDKVS